MKHLSKHDKPNTIFDVGCGCGANMYLFQNDGISVGGMDYSSAQIEIAKRLFKTYGDNLIQPLELICAEAINIPTEIKYDSIVANSVFSYFKDEIYAENVLNKMFLKAKNSIGLIDLHDSEKRDAFEEYRKKTVKDYEVRYKDLHKLFYRRDFFYDWAMKNNLEIEFHNSQVEGYWNNEFVFDVYIYKK